MTTQDSRSRILPDVYLVWLGEHNDECRQSIAHVRQVIDTVHVFDNIDECIDFITDRPDETVYMITSETYAQQLLVVTADIPQLKSVYTFYQKNIVPICDALKQALKDNDNNEVSINFAKSTSLASNKNKDILDCTFMYTQILKEILLTIDFNEQNFNDFLTFCRNEFKGKTKELKHVDEIQKDYRNQTPIWWYTRETFLYKILNKALRLMNIDIILQISFFVCDLHKQIAALHAEQFTEHTSSNSFVVYRGQGMSQADFDQMKQNKGGLLAFNNFLSTSKRREVSLRFIRPIITKRDSVPVLFVMNIDPTIIHTPFAHIRDISNKKTEDETLFSMHSVFRIGEIEKLDDDNRIWKAELTFTSDNDPDLRALTEKMREEMQGPIGRYRLGFLMIKLNKLDQAEKLYQSLLRETTDQSEKALCFHQLAWVYTYQGKYEEAAKYYHKSLEIMKKSLPVDHPNLATSYNNIGSLYQDSGEYPNALEYFHKSLEIKKISLPVDHPDLATSYKNIGTVYLHMGEYAKALDYNHKSLEIEKISLPVDHPDFATSYNNIGTVYLHMGEYAKALEYYHKSLEIKKRSLPVDHPDFATSYNNIGSLYQDIGEYPKALEYYHKSLEIMKRSLPVDHPHLAITYNSIGMVCDSMGEYTKELEYYHKSLEIRKKSLPVDHPDLATSYNNIGMVYKRMGEYTKALEYFHKSLEIRKKSLPADHPDFATSYNNIGSVYQDMGEYTKALDYNHKSLEIMKKSLPVNHPDLATSYNNIGSVYHSMNEYATALEYNHKSLEIAKKSLPADHPDFATSYNNIGSVYQDMGEYTKALEYFHKSLEIRKKSLPVNHPDLAASYNNIGMVYHSMNEYAKALEYFHKSLEFFAKTLPSNHETIKILKKNIETLRSHISSSLHFVINKNK